MDVFPVMVGAGTLQLYYANLLLYSEDREVLRGGTHDCYYPPICLVACLSGLMDTVQKMG